MSLVTSPPETEPREPDQRRDRPSAERVPARRQVAPWLMLVPSLAVLGVLVGYPLIRLVLVSFQEYGRAQVFGQPAPFVGLDNYREVLTDPVFWRVFERSVIFCLVNVVATMVLGT